jgi:hypothetical protein
MKKQQQQEEEEGGEGEGGEGEGAAILRNPVDNNQDRHFSPFAVEPSPHPALQRLDHVAGLVLLSQAASRVRGLQESQARLGVKQMRCSTVAA